MRACACSRAAQGSLVFGAFHLCAADGALRRRLDGRLVAVARLRLHGDHFGDDLARTLNHHAVADANVLLADVVDVVQGGA